MNTAESMHVMIELEKLEHVHSARCLSIWYLIQYFEMYNFDVFQNKV